MQEWAAIAYKNGGFDAIKRDGGALVPVEEITQEGITTIATNTNTSTPVTGEAGSVSQLAANRIARHEAYLAQNGIILPPPVYTAGTRVIDTGHDNFRTSRMEWEKLPFAKDAALALAKTVNDENRDDVVIPADKLKMNPDGTISIPDGPLKTRNIYVEPIGFGQLIESANGVLPRAKSLMAMLRPGLRAQVFNEQIVRLVNTPLKLRLRDNRGGKQARESLYSVVSKSYSAFDINELARTLADSFADAGYRAEVAYDPATTKLKFTAYYHADKVVDLAAGDVFKVGVQITAADNGTGGINVKAVAIRNRCLNLIILGTGEANLLSKRHRGEQSFTEVLIWDAINRATDIFAPFAEEWGIARRVDMGAVVNSLVKDEDLITEDQNKSIANWLAYESDVGKAVNVKPEVFSDMLMATLAREPGDSIADWTNALTRLHEIDALSESNVEAVEALAYPVMRKLTAKAKAMQLT
jgi:hypothetical protein